MIEWIAMHPEFVGMVCGSIALGWLVVMAWMGTSAWLTKRRYRDAQFQRAMHDYRTREQMKRDDAAQEDVVLRRVR